jgi:LAS superfamily LD-carboxypeptidase LdcB
MPPEPIHETRSSKEVLVTGLLVILLGTSGFLLFSYISHSRTIKILNTQVASYEAIVASTTKTLADERNRFALAEDSLSEQIAIIQRDLKEYESNYLYEVGKNDEFADKIAELSSTVSGLNRLSQIDKEVLQKYSKTYFLNENYYPQNLKKIKDKYVMEGRDEQYFVGDAMDFLTNMLDDAKDDGFDLKIVSAYRSFDQQQELKGNYTQSYGSGANAFSADQGYSEHQLGTTVDIVDTKTNNLVADFKNTEAYQWLTKNAYRYGFILSYPENNDFYVFEPWHWRFVGIKLARDLRRKDASFYDWNQRQIDEYLMDVFEQP